MTATSVTTDVTLSYLDINDQSLASCPGATYQLVDQAIIHHISVGSTSVPNVRIYDDHKFNALGTNRICFGGIIMTVHDVAVRYDIGSDPQWERHLVVIFTTNSELDRWPKEWQLWLGANAEEPKNHCLMYYIFVRILEFLGLSTMVYSEDFETAVASKLWDTILQANTAITRDLKMRYDYTYDNNSRSVGTATVVSSAFANSLRDKLSPKVEIRTKQSNPYMKSLVVIATVMTPAGICQRMRIINRHYCQQVDEGRREVLQMINQLVDVAYPGSHFYDALECIGVDRFIRIATQMRDVSTCRVFGERGQWILISIESGRMSSLIDYSITDRREDEAYRNEHQKPYTGATDPAKEEQS